MQMKASRYCCCGVAVKTASYISAVSEIIIGVAMLTLMLCLRNSMCIVNSSAKCIALSSISDAVLIDLAGDAISSMDKRKPEGMGDGMLEGLRDMLAGIGQNNMSAGNGLGTPTGRRQGIEKIGIEGLVDSLNAGIRRSRAREGNLKKLEEFVAAENRFYWLFTVCIACSGIQAVMGIVLCIAVKMQNQYLCSVWILTAAATCLFTTLFVRIFNILVVHEFYKELDAHRRQNNVYKLGDKSHSVPAGEVYNQPHQVPAYSDRARGVP